MLELGTLYKACLVQCHLMPGTCLFVLQILKVIMFGVYCFHNISYCNYVSQQ